MHAHSHVQFVEEEEEEELSHKYIINNSCVSIVTRLRIGRRGFNSRQRQGLFTFTTAGFEAHAASYPMGTGGCFPGENMAGA
jgi:hypothetical protein